MQRPEELLAVLGELTELVDSAGSLSELLQTTCERVVAHTNSTATYVITVDAGGHSGADLAAVAGPAWDVVRFLSISTDQLRTSGNGLFGLVSREQRTVVTPDIEQDVRFGPMQQPLTERGILSAVGVPIVIKGRYRGALVVTAERKNHYTGLTVTLLERIAGVLALGMARLEAARSSTRYRGLYSALSSVNELIAQGPDQKSLFKKTVELIAASSESLRANIALVDHETGKIRVVAAAGRTLDGATKAKLKRQKLSIDPRHVGGQGILGTTFRAGETVVWRDLSHLNVQGGFRDALCRLTQTKSLVGIPVFLDGLCQVILVLGSTEPDYFEADIVPLSQRLGESLHIALTTERQKAALEQQALTDDLTGLPNRVLFRDRLDWAVHHGQRYRKGFAVVVVDIDNFKAVNDRCGHPVGDEILRTLGEKLTTRLRKSDMVARFGADIFALIVWGTDKEAELAGVVRGIQAAVEQTGSVQREAATLTLSIGMALFPHDGATADELTRRADLALHRVKRAGGAGWGLFEPQLERELLERHGLEQRFLAALEGDRITYHFQPVVDLWKGRVAAAEMLVRWVDPQRGIIAPAAWVPAIEESETLISALGRHTLRAATAQLARWRACGIRIDLSVNMGARYLRTDGFVDDLKASLELAPQLANSLILEVTETAVIEDFRQMASVLQQARALGVKVALDDFGTGHGSLTYLLELPADHLKVDLLFVRRMLHELRAFGIVCAVAQGARMLGMSAVAEGVETEEHILRLTQMGCRYVQGFAIAPAMAIEAFEEWIRRWQLPPACQGLGPIAAEQNQLLGSLVLHRQLYQELKMLRIATPSPCLPSEALFCPLDDDPQTLAAFTGDDVLLGFHAKLHALEHECIALIREGNPNAGLSVDELAMMLQRFELMVNECLSQSRARHESPSLRGTSYRRYSLSDPRIG